MWLRINSYLDLEIVFLVTSSSVVYSLPAHEIYLTECFHLQFISKGDLLLNWISMPKDYICIEIEIRVIMLMAISLGWVDGFFFFGAFEYLVSKVAGAFGNVLELLWHIVYD